MKLLTTFFFVAFCTHFFAQTTITLDQAKVNNGSYLYNNTPFSGTILKIENNQMTEKFSVKDGKLNGQFISYYINYNFNKEKYRDSAIISSLNNLISDTKSKIPAIINDTISTWNSMLNCFNEEIGGSKKFEKLNEKFNSQKLKGEQLNVWNKYNSLKSQHSTSKQLLTSTYTDIDNKEKNLRTELNKPEYIPIKKIVCSFLNGQKNGDYVEYYSNEKLKVKGTYRAGLQEGIWEYYGENGNLIAKGNIINGDGSDISSIGVPRNGRDGTWTTYHSNGKIDQVSNWKSGKQNGAFTSKNEDGILTEESFYTDGKLNGNLKLYNSKGTLIESSKLSLGKLNGNLKKYNDQGVLILDENYIDDKKNGLCREFYPNGTIKAEAFCKNDKLNGNSKIFYENGKVEVDMTYKDNVPNGPAKNYYENGKIKLDGQYVNGKIHGPSKIYYESGQLQLVGFVDTNSLFEGHLSGEVTNYNEDGSIKLKAIINNDGTVIDKTPKPKSILSEAEMKKPYKCQCCKATINGIYDGVDKNGSPAEEFTVTYLYKVWSDPELQKSMKNLGVYGTVYDQIRDSYKFCTMKCSRTCYDY